jgi:trehalose/maltose hydrolase-like predicted phosphorylase
MTHASIPARGLSGQVYKGGIFWDTEIFMLPFFDVGFPELARNLLLYRYHTLDGARRKAREYGFRGAFYAWESQDTGDDACTLFNVTDVFTNRPMRTYFRDKQVHISADVVYAFWQYYTLTGDVSIWAQGGAEVVFECARFFASYLYYRPELQRYEVLDVTGPDEYHERVHNNAFTNWMVAHTLDVCLKVADLMQQQSPQIYASVFDNVEAQQDLVTIRQMAEGIYRPESVARQGVIPQFDGYFSLEDVSMQDLLARRLDPHEYLGGGNGLATTTQILKQADVVLGLFLFGEQFSLENKQANWDYYEPRCENGSSLSACSYSMIAAQLGRVDWAYKYFMKTATIDITGEGKQYVGPLYIGGTHPAANGGAWMAAIFGLCGFHCDETILHVHPHLPASWQQVEFPVKFKGQSLRVAITHQSITLTEEKPLTVSLSVEVNGNTRPVENGLEIAYEYPVKPHSVNSLY